MRFVKMKDLKSLYLTAKTSGGQQKDINAYTEAVNELLNSNPNDYILNLEYIISSDIGLQTFDTFIEKYGLSIACYDNVMECLEKCIEKCNDKKENDSEYKKRKEKLKEFKENHQNCFTMYEYFADELADNYLSTYYSFNDNGIQRRKLPIAMIDRFGEAAIPDILVTSESLNCIEPTLNFLTGKTILSLNERFNSPVFQQWMAECVNDVLPSNMINPYKDTLQSIVESMRSRNKSVYRESVITGKNDTYLEYSQEELQALQELITFKEYQVVSCENPSKAIEIQNEIYSLYEEFDGLIDEAGNFTSIIESEEFTELRSWVNTRNKKTGDIPDYIKRNHNVGYGEDEPTSDDNTDDVSLSDFERPSAKTTDKTASVEPLGDEGEEEPEADQPVDKSAVNNYYYYTYNNSLNKNSHSFNKDNSTHDNHSKHDNSVTNDSSVHNSTRRINDDHSTNKRINSHDYNGYTYDDEVESESYKPWELNIFGDNSFSESKNNIEDEFDKILDKHLQFRKECNSETETQSKLFKYLYKKNIDSVKLEPVPDTITIKIGSIDFIFIAEVGNGYIEDGKTSISDFSQVPCAVYLFQMNKDKICKKLGIEEELKKYIKILYDEDPSYYDNKTTDGSIDDLLKRYNFKAKSIYFNQLGHLGFYFDTDIEPEHGVGVSISPSMKTRIGDGATYIFESVGDADDLKPESDHPVKDILTDVDRKLVGHQQKAKKKLQDVQNAGRAFMKPINRSKAWISNILSNWKDNDETKVKEKMADPHARNNLFSAIAWSIKAGSFAKAGLLLNPVFLFLSITKGVGKNKRMQRIRNEMIGELKTELEIIDEKIKDADSKGDKKAKYQLMRLKNEINKKYIRVGGGKGWSKIL